MGTPPRNKRGRLYKHRVDKGARAKQGRTGRAGKQTGRGERAGGGRAGRGVHLKMARCVQSSLE